MSITLGTDSELFFSSDGEVASAVGLIGGDKLSPILFDGFNLQEDNVLGEFAINPCHNVGQWNKRIDDAIERLGAIAKGNGMDLSIIPSSVLEDKWLQSEAAKVFGCTPDVDVYSGQAKRPTPNGGLRTCGGHIHAGYKDVVDCDIEEDVIKWMDIHLGVPSVLLDEDHLRRGLYGQAGSFRLKPYGVEYRVLSNFWLDGLKEWVWNNAMKAVEDAINGPAPDVEGISEAINSSDKGKAQRMIKQFNVEMPA